MTITTQIRSECIMKHLRKRKKKTCTTLSVTIDNRYSYKNRLIMWENASLARLPCLRSRSRDSRSLSDARRVYSLVSSNPRLAFFGPGRDLWILQVFSSIPQSTCRYFYCYVILQCFFFFYTLGWKKNGRWVFREEKFAEMWKCVVFLFRSQARPVNCRDYSGEMSIYTISGFRREFFAQFIRVMKSRAL